jgi:hypothetical protein
MKIIKLLLLLIIFLSGCVYSKISQKEPGMPSPLTISRVSIDKKSFDPLQDKKVGIKFYLSGPADEARVDFYDINGRLIKSEFKKKTGAGFNTFYWDGKDNTGELTRSDAVIYTLTARNPHGSCRYDPADETGGMEIFARDFIFDRATGEITYVLPRAARVRLRAGIREGALLKTIYDWIPQEAGAHKFSWDGLDESGTIMLLKHPDLNFNLACYSLPDNCLLINNGRRDIPEDSNAPQRLFDNEFFDGKYLHYTHKPSHCHEPGFTVSFPGAPVDEHGIPRLKGKVPVKIEISREDKEYLINKKFEVSFFVDTIFLYEEEDGSSPFTFYWDASSTNAGEHFLTINIIGYDDHVGTKTKKVLIGGEKCE